MAGSRSSAKLFLKEGEKRDSGTGKRVELFMLLLLLLSLLLLLFYFPHSLLTDVHSGNIFGDCLLPSSSSYLSCNSSFFSPSPASISGENSVLECVISCSWETGLDPRSTSVQSMSFPKSTCSPRRKTSKFHLGFPDRQQLGQR